MVESVYFNILLTSCDRDGSKSSALHLVLHCCNPIDVDYLIKTGAHLNVHDWNGFTQLHYALICNYTELAMHLVEKGADVNIPDSGGRSPLQLSVIKNNVKCVKHLVKFNANVNYQGPKKLTALSMAIRRGRMVR
ncbi:Serine/threonine-protein phosphatase 6 regulatory ankyrin repeat subunit C [Zootermopsis nevadensis]|uniref:Serine/threonine-protein phosphatase 6 regulatory ankyrin repeat subunit C n=1 Tax=Zootermopsis nevadensis TaxID=136037 RepID=A0A067QQ45_ZOONE|nr:Serine/threonine-protein phosphatase 6 regulatory ankyrin repeat subunit C [Zootermopsis nevadensis]